MECCPEQCRDDNLFGNVAEVVIVEFVGLPHELPHGAERAV